MRTVKQKLTGYMPVVSTMTLDCVASHINVAHHNRSQIYSIEVDPTKYMPVTIHEGLAVWEEVGVKY